MTKKWSNLNLPGALHYVTGNVLHRIPISRKRNANPVKARLVISAEDYKWTSFRAFYFNSGEPLPVDHDWWWPDDSEKLLKAMKERGQAPLPDLLGLSRSKT